MKESPLQEKPVEIISIPKKDWEKLNLKLTDLQFALKEANEELQLYDKAYRALVDQVNAMEPDVRVQQLKQALDEEKRKKQRLRDRLRIFVDKEVRERPKPTVDPVAKSKRRHQHRRVNRRKRR